MSDGRFILYIHNFNEDRGIGKGAIETLMRIARNGNQMGHDEATLELERMKGLLESAYRDDVEPLRSQVARLKRSVEETRRIIEEIEERIKSLREKLSGRIFGVGAAGGAGAA